ncbi:MAG: phenylacetic acid degradation protein [Planctomycetota bacterium]|nr:MAG: phenylacetic acid degradation protein [Planctomycetota bacterium]
MRLGASVLLCAAVSLVFARSLPAKESPVATPTALQEYVAAKDASFGYKLLATDRLDGCAVHKVELTSQTWQDITWKHALYVYVPENVRYEDTVLLFITGGKIGGQPGEGDIATGVKLAQRAEMPVAFLHQVPNQPLLGDRVEDDLITETFLRYLETRDATWPLLFPMVKSAVKAMDAIQQLGRERYGVSVRQFVVTGGSKRGWTTWLTAVADPRVAGIAPIVIDTLNFAPQMKHQLECWGEYSEQIADYTSKGLVEVMEKQPEIPLWRWVDPYTYRDKLKLPKLIINGTNDRYWTVDALSLYWDGLTGEKRIRYVPNAGHGLDGGREGALITLAAFAQHVAEGRPMPELDWKFEETGEELRLTIDGSPTPDSVRLWVARSDTRDFREAQWTATELKRREAGGDGGEHADDYVGAVEKPDQGYIAVFGEATFSDGPFEYNMSTLLRQQ